MHALLVCETSLTWRGVAGVFLRDLHFIDLGNDTWIGDKVNEVVNFEKVTRMVWLYSSCATRACVGWAYAMSVGGAALGLGRFQDLH